MAVRVGFTPPKRGAALSETQSAYYLKMNITRCQPRRWAAGLTMMISLPLIGVALAPTSLADDFDCIGSVSLDCMMNSGSGLPDPQAGWTQPGDLVIPAGGGLPQVAVAPAPPGAPVVTAGGGLPVIPAGPPIGGMDIGGMGMGGMGMGGMGMGGWDMDDDF